MPIQNRTLAVGSTLVGRYRKHAYACEVVQVEGALHYRLGDGRTFTSLSAAASALMDGKAVNGWAFWSLAHQDDRTAAAGVPESPSSAAPAAKRQRRARTATAADDATAGAVQARVSTSVADPVTPEGHTRCQACEGQGWVAWSNGEQGADQECFTCQGSGLAAAPQEAVPA